MISGGCSFRGKFFDRSPYGVIENEIETIIVRPVMLLQNFTLSMKRIRTRFRPRNRISLVLARDSSAVCGEEGRFDRERQKNNRNKAPGWRSGTIGARRCS